MNILWKRDLTGRLFSQNLTWPDGSLIGTIVYIYPLRDRYLLGGLYRVFSHYFSDKISSNCLVIIKRE